MQHFSPNIISPICIFFLCAPAIPWFITILGLKFIIPIVVAIVALIVGVPVVIEFYKTHYITKVPSAILATGIMTLSIIIAQCGAILDIIVKEHKEKLEHQLLNYEQIQKIKGYIKNSGGG